MRKQQQVESIEEMTGEALIAQLRLSKDLQLAARLLSREQIRFLVDLYYILQENRIRAQAQVRTAGEEPNLLISWTYDLYRQLETDVRQALLHFAEGHIPGQWALSVKGIGPVLAAGLIARIDITKTPTVGALWRRAGYDPTSHWLGKGDAQRIMKKYPGPLSDEVLVEIARETGRNASRLYQACVDPDTGEVSRAALTALLAKRPWDAALKRLCWLAGQSFVKSSGREGSFYGPLYRQRKLYEMQKNEEGAYADEAARVLKEKFYGKDTEAYKWYAQGKLPPAHIQARVERWVVKLFLSHLHAVMYEDYFGKPAPRPYIIAIGGHQDYIEIPNWPILSNK